MADVKFDIESLRRRGNHFQTSDFLVEDSLKNRVIGDSCTGYSVKIKCLSYRSIWVSTIEDITLKVDGVEVPKSNILLCVNNKKFLVSQLTQLFAEYWYAIEDGEIIVNQIGGLSKGEHEIDITIMRHNDFGYSHEFVAFPNTDCKKFTVS